MSSTSRIAPGILLGAPRARDRLVRGQGAPLPAARRDRSGWSRLAAGRRAAAIRGPRCAARDGERGTGGRGSGRRRRRQRGGRREPVRRRWIGGERGWRGRSGGRSGDAASGHGRRDAAGGQRGDHHQRAVRAPGQGGGVHPRRALGHGRPGDGPGGAAAVHVRDAPAALGVPEGRILPGRARADLRRRGLGGQVGTGHGPAAHWPDAGARRPDDLHRPRPQRQHHRVLPQLPPGQAALRHLHGRRPGAAGQGHLRRPVHHVRHHRVPHRHAGPGDHRRLHPRPDQRGARRPGRARSAPHGGRLEPGGQRHLFAHAANTAGS